MSVLGGIRRAGRTAFLAVAATIVFIEEFGWRPLSAWLGRLARWPPLAALEARIARLPARPALALFGVPTVLLFPIKLAALSLMKTGHPWVGVAVVVCAKVFGTAIVGRLFVLLESQLRQFPWIVRALDWWIEVRRSVVTAVRASRLGRRLRAWRSRWRAWRRRALSS